MSAPRLVFTGFEPFGEHSYNPSWDVAQAAARELGAQAHLLEVTFDAARAAAELLEPQTLVVHVGVAASRDTVDFERYAHNATGDYESETEGLGSLVVGGVTAHSTGVPLTRLVALWDHASIGARESRDAGVYVCNATYFHSLQAAVGYEGADALFVHVPMVGPAQAADLGVAIARALRAI